MLCVFPGAVMRWRAEWCARRPAPRAAPGHRAWNAKERRGPPPIRGPPLPLVPGAQPPKALRAMTRCGVDMRPFVPSLCTTHRRTHVHVYRTFFGINTCTQTQEYNMQYRLLRSRLHIKCSNTA